MTKRFPSEQRRAQIVTAALDLLADTPVEELTTRSIAKRVGISQPALFRHFRSREQILEAVVKQSRAHLVPIAEEVLALDGLTGLRCLARGLVEHAKDYPGLPRLLFHSMASETEGSSFEASLRFLLSLQHNLVAELIRQAQRLHELPNGIPVQLAAELFISLLQGRLLQSKFTESGGTDPDSLMDFWLAGAQALPKVQESIPVVQQFDPFLSLDVAPIIAAGIDPLEKILAAVEQLPKHGVLQLRAPFRPDPLLGLLHRRGFRSHAIEIRADAWQIEIYATDAPEVLELLELETPEPMVQVLLATAKLEPEAAILARVPRVPALLLPRLTERGLQYDYQEGAAAGVLLMVRNPAQVDS